MIDWNQYYEDNIIQTNYEKRNGQIYNNQEAAKNWDEFKECSEEKVLNLLSADLVDCVKEKYVTNRGAVADVGIVDEVSKFIHSYVRDLSNSLMRKLMFSVHKFKTEVKPDEDRKFDPVFYNKAFKQYQAELLYFDAQTLFKWCSISS
jgi:hypothetical protein